jgi:hypothetical protein
MLNAGVRGAPWRSTLASIEDLNENIIKNGTGNIANTLQFQAAVRSLLRLKLRTAIKTRIAAAIHHTRPSANPTPTLRYNTPVACPTASPTTRMTSAALDW